MDLSSLWNYEKTRVSTSWAGSSVQGPTRIAKATTNKGREVPQNTISNGNSRPSSKLANSNEVSSIPQRRKTVSIIATREMLHRKLVEDSASPSSIPAKAPGVAASLPPTTSLFDWNEFSEEYASRGPAGPSTRNDQPSPRNMAASTRIGSAASPMHHHRANGRAGSAAVASLSASASSPLLGASASSPSFISPTATMVLPRKNVRKRLANDLSAANQTFRPYVGDMFGTRGDYVDGMLYMSRMKRSYQATFGAGGRWNDSGVAGRGHIKEALVDALLAAAGGRMGARHSAAATDDTGANQGSDGNSGDPTEFTGSNSEGNSIEEEVGSTGDDGEELAGLDPLQRQQRRRRQRCALTLSNWSANPDNARLMVQENVVEALILLCRGNGEEEDRITKLHCVTTLMNLSHLVELRAAMIAQGAVQTLASLVDSSEDRILRTACAIALCNLSGVEGAEEMIVAHGAVGALTLLISEHPGVARICRSALFNLTSVPAPYPKIENVLKVFISFAASPPPPVSPVGNLQRVSASGPNVAHDANLVIARALCNLSLFKRLRLRLLEEGVVGAVGSLLQPGAPLVQELLARVLLHLSSLRACRGDLIAKGALGTLVALTGGAAGSSSTKLLIAGALWHLSKEGEFALRMVSEGLLLLINELARGVGNDSASPPLGTTAATSTGDALLAACAHTLYNVSCREDARAKLVERDAVVLLSSISRRVIAPDARKMCTLALCNLLSVQQAATEILKTGAVAELIALSSATSQSITTRRLFARALHGLCDRSSTRLAVLEAGVVPALLVLSGCEEESANTEDVKYRLLLSEIRASCTAALSNLAADLRTAEVVSNPSVVTCVARILALERGNVGIERFCCACLSLLCRDETCAQLIVANGSASVRGAEETTSALSTILLACVNSKDLETKASGCHVLASLSLHASCGASLLQTGTVSVLASLASVKDRDPAIPRCCAVTLANLSAEPAVRPILLAAGAVALLARLSNSYSEDTQRDCAAVLCNLACLPGGEETLAREGAVRALMMIAMVRAVSRDTKNTCLRALLNLLNAETIKGMVAQEGIVKVLPTFATQAPPSLVSLMFSKLLRHPIGRNALCAERRALQSLFDIIKTDPYSDDNAGQDERVQTFTIDREMQCSLTSLYESLVSEVVYHENSRALAVQVGLVDALNRVASDQLAMLEDEEKSLGETVSDQLCRTATLATSMFTLAKHSETRSVLAAAPASFVTLVQFMKPHSPRSDCTQAKCADVSISTLCLLGWYDDTREKAATTAVTSSLIQILRATAGLSNASPSYYSPSSVKTCVMTLCCLSSHLNLLRHMLGDGIVIYLHGIFVGGAHGKESDSLEAASTCASDKEFVALVCILFRHLSQVPEFTAMQMTSDPANGSSGGLLKLVELFSALTALVTSNGDVESCLDCADALSSIIFTTFTSSSPISNGGRSPTQKSSSTAGQALVSTPIVASIAQLLNSEQRPETRWRCCACLWAMAAIPENRAPLVQLGVTKLLVAETYRSSESLSLSTLQCCAAALSYLTLVHPGVGPSANASSTAAKMVEEGAVPALIALGKLDSDSVREFCTIALSNLSGPAPTVEAGAVAALLSLTLVNTPAPSSQAVTTEKRGISFTSTPPIGPHPTLARPCRPPFVCDERHRQFVSTLPSFEPSAPLDRHHELHERKFESELPASSPPPPRLPVFSFGESANRDPHSSENQADQRPPTPTLNGAEPPVMVQTQAYPKIDPADCLLTMHVEEGGESAVGEQSDHPVNRSGSLRRGLLGNQSDEDDNSPSRRQPARLLSEEEATPTIEEDSTGSAREESVSDKTNAAEPDALKGNNLSALSSSSSLARVVGKNMQVMAATKKLKSKLPANARVRKPLATSGSLPSLPIGPNNGNEGSTSKRSLLQEVPKGGSDRAGVLRDSSIAPGKSAWQIEDSTSTKAKDQLRSIEREDQKAADARAALAAAAMAARLYNAAPETTSAPTVEEFQKRVKTLGLWS